MCPTIASKKLEVFMCVVGVIAIIVVVLLYFKALETLGSLYIDVLPEPRQVNTSKYNRNGTILIEELESPVLDAKFGMFGILYIIKPNVQIR